MFYVPFRKGNAPLSAIAFHAVDTINYPTEFVRGSHAALARREIDELWGHTRPLVLLGDFNAEVTAKEVHAREGLFVRARRDLKSVTDGIRIHYGRRSPPLENLMGRLDLSTGSGTYFLKNEQRWVFIDQIAVSEELSSSVLEPPRVLKVLCSEDLLTRDGRPKQSDHLPVQATIQVS